MKGYFLSIRAFFAWGAAVSCLVLAAGCGGDSSDSSNASASEVTVKTGSLSKGEFIQKVNLICKEGQDAGIAKLRSYLTDQRIKDPSELSDKQADEVLSSVVTPTYEEEINRISQVGAPTADAKKIEAMLEEMRTGLEKSQGNAFEALKRNLILGKASQLAASYGLSTCSISWG